MPREACLLPFAVDESKALVEGILEQGDDGLFGEISDDTEKIAIPKVFGDLIFLARHHDFSTGGSDAFDFNREKRAGIGGLEAIIKTAAEAGDVREDVAGEIGDLREG